MKERSDKANVSDSRLNVNTALVHPITGLIHPTTTRGDRAHSQTAQVGLCKTKSPPILVQFITTRRPAHSQNPKLECASITTSPPIPGLIHFTTSRGDQAHSQAVQVGLCKAKQRAIRFHTRFLPLQGLFTEQRPEEAKHIQQTGYEVHRARGIANSKTASKETTTKDSIKTNAADDGQPHSLSMLGLDCVWSA